MLPWIYYIKEDEQLLVEDFTRRWVVNGPGTYVSKLFERVRTRKALTLGPTDYLRLRSTLTGELRNEIGPKLYFAEVTDQLVQQLSAISLKKNQYIRLIDKRTGVIRVEKGEKLVYLSPTEEALEDIAEGINIDENITVLVRDTLTGQLEVVAQTQVFIPSPTQHIVEIRKRLPLKKNHYIRLIDKRTGVIRVEKGEQSVYLGPNEEVLEKVQEGINIDDRQVVLVRDKTDGQLSIIAEPQVFIPSPQHEIVEVRKRISLKRNEYARLMDKSAGTVRVERGEQNIFLQPYEELLEGPLEGVNIDEHHAVLARDIASGQLQLITTPQVFIPTAEQEVVEVRERILLEDHQMVIIKDKAGKYIFKRGSDQERSFFLEPYCSLVRLFWSTGLHKDDRSLVISHFDLRPKFMWYELEARTQDNVELTIGVTFFWQVADVEAMLWVTDDVPGDVCSHARSAIIQAVSRVTLEAFLATFNDIVRDAVLGGDDRFYTERGTQIHAVEVRSVACKEASTQRVLQEIIQETTNRLNRLHKQESENEVGLAKMRGEIDTERLKTELLEMRRAHAQIESTMHGETEAIKVRGLLDGLGDIPLGDKLNIFNTLRKREALEALSGGNAQIYYTPADVDLAIETRN